MCLDTAILINKLFHTLLQFIQHLVHLDFPQLFYIFVYYVIFLCTSNEIRWGSFPQLVPDVSSETILKVYLGSSMLTKNHPSSYYFFEHLFTYQFSDLSNYSSRKFWNSQAIIGEENFCIFFYFHFRVNFSSHTN